MLSILPDGTESVVRCTIGKKPLLCTLVNVLYYHIAGAIRQSRPRFPVNDVERSVTANLADALRHLRLLELLEFGRIHYV